MPPVSRQGDTCNHPCWSSHVIQMGSNNVFTNNIPTARLQDPVTTHCCVTCHSGTFCKGSNKVFVNGKPCIRIGDSVDCGSMSAMGSSNVFAN
jgi:uncharacterized Zn-binding protein involved in type VI secretion